jgi:hypothetical protein
VGRGCGDASHTLHFILPGKTACCLTKAATAHRHGEPSEAIGIHFPLKLLHHFKRTPPTPFAGNDIADALASRGHKTPAS